MMKAPSQFGLYVPDLEVITISFSSFFMPIGVPKVPFRLPGEEDAAWVDV